MSDYDTPFSEVCPVYLPARLTDKRYQVIYGGAGSSKSGFCGQRVLDKIRNRQRRILAVRKVKTTVRHSIFQLLTDCAKAVRWHDCRFNKTEMSVTAPGGGMIITAGLDDVEKLKSIAGITDIWAEEATELSMEDLAQLDLRLRGVPDPTFTLTFNPTFEANMIFDYIGFPVADLPERSYVETETAFIQHTTYLDNPFIDPGYMTVFENLAKISESFRDIYMLGKIAVTDEPDQLIKWEWVKAAFHREIAWTDGRQRAGIDVGRYGNDPSVLVHLDGYALKNIEEIPQMGTTEQGKHFGSYINEHGIPAELTGVDSVGVGSGVVDTMYDMEPPIECTEIIGGAKPLEYVEMGAPVSFVNLRGQMWWWLRHTFETGMVSLKNDNIDNDKKRQLQEDLLATRYRYKSEKEIEIEPKETRGKNWGIRQRLGRSPDKGDGLAMGVFVDRYIVDVSGDEYQEPQEEGVFEFEDDEGVQYLGGSDEGEW